ncbi:MmcQ/YjbR family DNA-binding protein [Williamsia deligens]|nr:YjbR protein [Williamsia deligens]
MFDDADPLLARVRAVALRFPEAGEVIAHGRPTFRCGKVFAHYGGSVRGGDRRDHSVLVKPDPAEAQALADDPRFFVPAYLGPAGWLGLDLDAAEADWDEIAELLDASYRLVAPARLVRILDA